MALGKSSLETILASFQWLRNELTKYFFSFFFLKTHSLLELQGGEEFRKSSLCTQKRQFRLRCCK